MIYVASSDITYHIHNSFEPKFLRYILHLNFYCLSIFDYAPFRHIGHTYCQGLVTRHGVWLVMEFIELLQHIPKNNYNSLTNMHAV
jgi:hypothetical protein